MRNPLLSLCALLALVAFSTSVRAGDLPSPDNAPPGQQLLGEPLGTAVNAVNGGAWGINADIPNVNGTSQTTTASDSNGNVYVIGGGAGPGPDVTLNTLWMYSPPDDTWTQMANVPTPLRAFGAVAVVSTPLTGKFADQFYVFGGFNGVSPINTLNIYDVGSDAWSTGTSIPPTGGGFGAAVCVVNGRIFVAGGSGGAFSAFEYDPGSDSYTAIAPLPAPGGVRSHGAGVDDLNECHTFGFSFDSTNHYIYDVDANVWTVGPPMPVGVTDPAVVTLGTDIYVIGGFCPFMACEIARTQIFNALDRTWSNGPDLPGPLNNTSGTLAIDTIYVEGGYDGEIMQSVPVNYSLFVGP